MNKLKKKVSWERIFDLELCSKLNEVNIEDLTLQGVTSKVPLSNVKLIKRICCKIIFLLKFIQKVIYL